MSYELQAALLLTYVTVTLVAGIAGVTEAVIVNNRTGRFPQPLETFAIRWIAAPLLVAGLAYLPLALVWALVQAWRAAL